MILLCGRELPTFSNSWATFWIIGHSKPQFKPSGQTTLRVLLTLKSHDFASQWSVSTEPQSPMVWQFLLSAAYAEASWGPQRGTAASGSRHNSFHFIFFQQENCFLLCLSHCSVVRVLSKVGNRLAITEISFSPFKHKRSSCPVSAVITQGNTRENLSWCLKLNHREDYCSRSLRMNFCALLCFMKYNEVRCILSLVFPCSALKQKVKETKINTLSLAHRKANQKKSLPLFEHDWELTL